MIYGDPIILGGGGSGGPTAEDAILLVTVPAGSSAVATKDGASISPTLWVAAADSSLEKALFVFTSGQFDAVTPWTVTASNGSSTASTTVLIYGNKEFETEISYELILFENGEWASETGGVTSTNCTIVDGDLRSIGSYSSVGKWCTVNQIDVSKYTTLCMLSKVAAGSSSRRMWFGTSDSDNIPSSDSSWSASLFTAYYSNVFSAAEADYTLKTADISAASALSYIKFGYYQQTLTKRIWLE